MLQVVTLGLLPEQLNEVAVCFYLFIIFLLLLFSQQVLCCSLLTFSFQPLHPARMGLLNRQHTVLFCAQMGLWYTGCEV